MFILILAGLGSLTNIKRELFPDIAMPEINIITILPGADSQTVDSSVTDIVEREMSLIPDIRKISSQSAESVSKVTIVFNDSVSLDAKLTDVRYHIDRLTAQLPQNIYGKPDAFISTMDMVPMFIFSVSDKNIDLKQFNLVFIVILSTFMTGA